MAYYVGDIPSEDIVIDPARGDEPIDLTPFIAGSTEVVLRDFEGTIITPAEFVPSFVGDQVVLEWPTDVSVFDQPGLYLLSVTLVGTGVREQLRPVYLVAQDPESGWHTLDSAREEWDGAPPSDYRLFQILELARQQVIAYAPALEADDPIPTNYREGQLMQARNLLNAGLVDPASGGVGSEDFVLRPFPLDWMVKQVLRPHSGVPRIG